MNKTYLEHMESYLVEKYLKFIVKSIKEIFALSDIYSTKGGNNR